jgi:hypothetical protein
MGAGSYERKQFVGGAPATSIVGAINDSVTTWSIDSAAGWPDATNPFVAVINRGLADEEKVLVNAITGTTVSSVERGYDDTAAQSHSSSATFEHVLDASTIDQANRYVNLQNAKGQIVGHDGTNPVAVPAGATDGFVLQRKNAEPSGLAIDKLVTVLDQSSAPSVAGNVQLWYDSTTGLLRPSDGTNWELPASLPWFSNNAGRDAYFGGTPTQDGIACVVGLGVAAQPQVWVDDQWIRLAPLTEAIPKFADTTARDAFYPSPATGDHAYITGTHQLLEYREDEWILLNQKITTSDTAPVAPHEGDIWLQPSS